MTYVLLIGLILGAIAVAARYAYLYAQSKATIEASVALNMANRNIMEVLIHAMDHDPWVHDILERLKHAQTAEELNDIYNLIVRGP